MRRPNIYKIKTNCDLPEIGNERILFGKVFQKGKDFFKEIFSVTTIASSIGFTLFDEINSTVVKKVKRTFGLIGVLDNSVELLEKNEDIDEVDISSTLSKSNLGIFTNKFSNFNSIANYYETINIYNGIKHIDNICNEYNKGKLKSLSSNTVDNMKKIVLAINSSNSHYFGIDTSILKPIIIKEKGKFVPLLIGCGDKAMIYDKNNNFIPIKIDYNPKMNKKIKCNYNNLILGYKSLSDSLRKLLTDINTISEPLKQLTEKVNNITSKSDDTLFNTNIILMLNYYLLFINETTDNLDNLINVLNECANNIANT